MITFKWFIFVFEKSRFILYLLQPNMSNLTVSTFTFGVNVLQKPCSLVVLHKNQSHSKNLGSGIIISLCIPLLCIPLLWRHYVFFSTMIWKNFFKFVSNIHLGMKMNWFDFVGQSLQLHHAGLVLVNRTPWWSLITSDSNVHMDSRMNWLEFSGFQQCIIN